MEQHQLRELDDVALTTTQMNQRDYPIYNADHDHFTSTISHPSCLTNHADVGFNASVVDDGAALVNDDDDSYFQSFPPGYRFRPHDEELVLFYLKKKIFDRPLPRNRIREVELYKNNPETLAANYKANGENEWYFFTPRDRKYRHGERPSRSAGDGYWKATGADKPITRSGGVKVGCRKALVFYKGKAPDGEKTDWIMHEYRIENPPQKKRQGNDMRLDDWVLCRIYKKSNKSNKATKPHKVDSVVKVQSSERSPEEYTIAQEPNKIVFPGHGITRKLPYMNNAYDNFAAHYPGMFYNGAFPVVHEQHQQQQQQQRSFCTQYSMPISDVKRHEQSQEYYYQDHEELLSAQSLFSHDFSYDNIESIDQFFNVEKYNNVLDPSPHGGIDASD